MLARIKVAVNAGNTTQRTLSFAKRNVWLHVEFEEEYVAVLDDVLFAFGAQQALFFYGLLAAVEEEVAGGVGVGLDEAAFEVGVDDAGGSRSFRSAFDGPGADFLHS